MIGEWCFVPGKPMVRGYDSGPLFRADCLDRFRNLQLEVEADMKELARMKKDHVVTEERIKRLKRELGISDKLRPRDK